MAEASTLAKEAGNTKGASNTATPAQPKPDQTLSLRLTPVDNSDQPVVANTSCVQLAPGMAFIDFGFIELGVLAALPRAAQRGGKLPQEIDGKLAVRVVMGFDGLAQLQRQLTRAMGELAEGARQQAGGKS